MVRTIVAFGAVLALASVAAAEDRKPAGKKDVLVHVVIFTMKEGTAASKVDEVIADCHKMLGKIKAVRGVKAGRPTKEAAEKFVQRNYDLGLVILVDDFKGLKEYLDDPIHVEFVKKHGKFFDIEKLKVFDFTDGK